MSQPTNLQKIPVHMMISKHAQFFLIYSAISIAGLAFSVSECLENSTTYYGFVSRLTDGLNLGMVLNFTLCCFIGFTICIQKLIFGETRLIEREHIVERLPGLIINLLLNLTTRDRNLILNVALLMLSLFSEVMHSLLKDRLDHQKVQISMKLTGPGAYDYKTVLKCYGGNVFMYWNMVFTSIDFLIAKFLVYDVFQGLNSVPCLLFGFRFAVKALELLAIQFKDCLDAYEYIQYPAYATQDDDFDIDIDEIDDVDDSVDKVWENKGYFVKTVDIAASSFKVLSYLTFIYLLGIHADSSIPFSMIQGAFVSARDTWVEAWKFHDFVKQSKKLDTQLKDATEDQLTEDNLCIICRDDMHAPEVYEATHHKKLSSRRKPKRISCGHILHLGCLKDWLERSDNCPLCRRKVFEPVQTAGATAETGATGATAAPVQAPEQAQAAAAAAAAAAQAVPQVPVQAIPNEILARQNENRRFQEFEDLVRLHRERVRNHEIRQPQNPPPNPTFPHQPQQAQQDPQAQQRSQNPQNSRSGSESQITPIRPTSSPAALGDRQRYQEINLPRNALLPPNWKVLPLGRISEGQYRVSLSTSMSAKLKLLSNRNGRELELMDPSRFVSVNVNRSEDSSNPQT